MNDENERTEKGEEERRERCNKLLRQLEVKLRSSSLSLQEHNIATHIIALYT